MKTVRSDTFRFGAAWAALTASVAIHLVDEAVNGFVDVYNLVATAIRESLPFVLLPTFTFAAWLTGLILAVCLLSAFSVLAFRGARWLLPLSYLLGSLMLLNGLGHVAGTAYLSRPMPGVYSSPLLLASSIYLLVIAERLRSAAPPAETGVSA